VGGPLFVAVGVVGGGCGGGGGLWSRGRRGVAVVGGGVVGSRAGGGRPCVGGGGEVFGGGGVGGGVVYTQKLSTHFPQMSLAWFCNPSKISAYSSSFTVCFPCLMVNAMPSFSAVVSSLMGMASCPQ